MPGDQRDDQSYGQVEETARPVGHTELTMRHAIAAYSRRLGLPDVDVGEVAGGERFSFTFAEENRPYGR